MRLIDADALKKQVIKGGIYYGTDFIKIIDNAPTIESKPISCAFEEFGKCSYKETGCSDCKIKSNLRYMCHSSAWQELQALREFKEKHEKKGEWIESPYEELRKHGYFKCSNCGVGFKRFDKEYQCYDNFCPNCGADMRGDV